MKELFCKNVEVSGVDERGSAGSILLKKSGKEIIEVILETVKSLIPGKSLIVKKEIDGKEIRINIWRSSLTQSIGTVSGPSCAAMIVCDGHTTQINFVFAEKSYGGHNPADLRLPLF